ncbi:hypothetical protein ACXM1Q_000215 [Streptococcus sp. 10F2]
MDFMNYYVSGEMARFDTTVSFGLEVKQSNQFMAAIEAAYKIKEDFSATKIKVIDVYVLEEEDD